MNATDTAGIAAPQGEATHLSEVAARLCTEGRTMLAAGQAGDAIKPLQQAAVARPLDPGVYDANVCVLSNDAANAIVGVAVEFTVTAADEIFANGFEVKP